VRIQVDCRTRKSGETEPRSFVLGNRRLWVLRILERKLNAASRHFVVSTTDGRRFALRQDLASGEWQLAGAMPATAG
jgi:hypothetical protein